MHIKIWKQKDKYDYEKVNNEKKLLPNNIWCIIQCRTSPNCKNSRYENRDRNEDRSLMKMFVKTKELT